MDVQSERRVVTALFVDVVGSTDLMMRVGPEVMRRRLTQAFGQMSKLITDQGGTVENFAGDAIFAIFGAPTAHADDPARAIRAAISCVDWSGAAGEVERLSVRVGVETGEALVDLEAVARAERMAIGSCVNTAARLQQYSSPGEVLVGPGTHAATANLARYESLGDLELKGLGSISAWRLVDLAVEVEGPTIPLIGRELELQRLNSAADQSAQGEQILALVVGDPGLGKSRLVQEFLARRRAPASSRILEIRCRPAGEEGFNTPLRQLIEADVPEANPRTVRDRLSSLLDPDDAELAAIPILHSTGLETHARLQAISRYEQRETISEAWRRYLGALAGAEPVILAIEDIHWADPVLVRMVDRLTSAGDEPILVIATARPEFGGSAHLDPAENRVQIDLEPLDATSAAELAQAAQGVVAGLDRAAGNPLFIIELARHLAGATSTIDLPVTIQAAIAARLDELTTEERQLLQQVSVAGESFNARDAALLADREPADVAGMLGRLAHAGFVEPAGAEYRFHHALVRDVAYGRLPLTARIALHVRYAERGVAPGDVVARAFHLWEATNPAVAEAVWEDSIEYQKLRIEAFEAHLTAGQQLESWNQYELAEGAYARAVELALDATQRGQALAEQGRVMARQGKGDDAWTIRLTALEAYAQAGSPAPARLYADMLEIATLNWGYFHQLPTDADVERLLDEGMRVAGSSDDDVSLARLRMERAAYFGDASDVAGVLAKLDTPEAVRFADAAHRSAQVLVWSGEFRRSLEIYRRVFEDLLPDGGLINEPEALIWYGVDSFLEGDLDLAMSLVRRAEADLAKGRSAHTASHVLGLSSLNAIGRGDWQELARLADAMEQLLVVNPDNSFCLVGGAAVGYGAVGRIIAGISLPHDLAAEATRMIEESELVQSSSVMLPQAMLGDEPAVDRGYAAYEPGLRLFDRAAAWDVLHLTPAITAVMLERWDRLEGPLARLDHCARGGSRLAAALATAAREERAAAVNNEGHPTHSDLLALGFDGFSELLRFRARTA